MADMSYAEFDPTHEAVQDPSELVMDRFNKGQLLVRVMEAPLVQKDDNGIMRPNLDIWEKELYYMETPEGLYHASATLLKQGLRIPLYWKPFGFGIDGTTVDEITHIANSDSGSRTGEDGVLRANPSDLKSIQDLLDYYEGRVGTQSMNELNVTIRPKDLIAFIIKIEAVSPTAILSFELCKRLVNTHGIHLPSFRYDSQNGLLLPYENPDIEALIGKIPRPETQKIYRTAIEESNVANLIDAQQT